jgi:hypothetical protein
MPLHRNTSDDHSLQSFFYVLARVVKVSPSINAGQNRFHRLHQPTSNTPPLTLFSEHPLRGVLSSGHPSRAPLLYYSFISMSMNVFVRIFSCMVGSEWLSLTVHQVQTMKQLPVDRSSVIHPRQGRPCLYKILSTSAANPTGSQH